MTAPATTNPFAGLADAKMSDKLPPLTEGKYLVQIDRITFIAARAGYNATVAEFTVIESSNPAHPAGVKRSYFQKMNVDAAMGALKGFAAALAGIDPKDSEKVAAAKNDLESFLGQAISKENPCEGVRVGVTVSNILTKEKKPFSKHDWSPAEQVE